MSFDFHSLTESLQFSDSDSLKGDITSIVSTVEVDNAYLITKIHYASKLKEEHVEMFPFQNPVFLKILDVEYCPVRCKNNINESVSDLQNDSWKEKTTQKFNPYVYKILIEYESFIWTIYRRYNDFLSVHDKIALRIATMKIPIPTKKATAERNSFKEETKVQSIKLGRKIRTLPPFPKRPEIFLIEENIEERRMQLETYMQSVLNYKVLHSTAELRKFFEVSIVSFINCLGVKRKEGIVRKRCGGRLVFTGCLEFINSLTYRWSTRWLFIKDTFIAYIKTNESRIGDVLLMDASFTVDSGNKNTGKNKGLIITNKNRKLFCICQSTNDMREWSQAIITAMNSTGKDFIHVNKHLSFAPLRSDTYCRWYIDGDRYMNAVSNSMENAKEEIYITDWWLSPQVHMKRPAEDNYWRLDHILLRKAEDGVLIFVLLYKEIEMTLNINSHYTKKVLSKLHPNIQVLRHPDHLRRRTFFWSHHEKMVIVDQKICFLGGIDLCFGRWDTPTHSIQDVMESGFQRTSILSNEDLNLIMENKRYFGETIHVIPVKIPFLGKHNLFGKGKPFFSMKRISIPSNSRPKSSSDTTQNVDLSNNCDVEIQSLKDIVKGNLKKKYINKNKLRKKLWNKEKIFNNNNSICSVIDDKNNVKTLFAGKDYVNWIVKDCVDLDKPEIDLIDRKAIPRMPWHDIGCVIYGRAARDAGRHFIQRWNSVKKEKANKNPRYNILVPKGYTHSEVQRITVLNSHSCTCQVLRSVSKWSANIDSTENSILNAYVDTIRKAKHYIYIENQFFISSTSQKSELIKNQIGREILNRIVHFHRKSKLFRVYILVPLLPAFESDIITSKSSTLHTILNYNYKSLFRGNDSLFGNLKKLKINPAQYIFLGSLRNFGMIGENLSTEQIYVHSKLLIVDDLYSIIGSSNLNDRSMLGHRDSEVAIWFKDEQFKNATFNKCKVKVGHFSSSLRKSLMAEHLGVLEHDQEKKVFFDLNLLNDPVGDSFFVTIWCTTARRNTELFDEIFACFPSNNYKSFVSIKSVKRHSLLKSDPKLAKEKVNLIRGHLVVYPTECLELENLEPSFVSKEGLIPADLWV